MKRLSLVLIFTFLHSLGSFGQYQSFKTPDGELAFQSFGKGFPVLIINGGPGISSSGFADLAQKLSEKNTTIIYDQRGTGLSKLEHLNSSTINLNLMVEDIELLRKHLGYDKWIVLGHSFGGMLAYAYSVKYPERVQAMIQSHSGGLDLQILENFDVYSQLSATYSDSLNHYSAKIQLGDTSEETARRRATILARAYLYNDSLATGISGRFMNGNMRINSLMWNDLSQNNFDLSAELSQFKKPVLILNGRNEVAPLSLAEKAHEILPNSQLVIIDRCGHYGWLDRPDIYLTEVSRFLKQHSKSNL
ncbi:alpha/beta fold hydrolase [Gramella sp. BOM4]|nr:alpha/beta fold hydrolase [Christiangramia bathymodioli]